MSRPLLKPRRSHQSYQCQNETPIADWFARRSFLQGGTGLYPGKSPPKEFPPEKKAIVHELLLTLDQLFWRDAVSVADDQEPRLLVMFQGGTGAMAGPHGFYFAGGPAFEFIVDKENQRIKGHILAHFEQKDPEPLLNANFDLEVTAKFHAGWVTGKDQAPGENVHGRIWNIPGVAAVIYGDRFGVLFNTGLNLLPYSPAAAWRRGLMAKHIVHFGILRGPVMAAGHLWGKVLGPVVASAVGGVLAVLSQGHSIQAKYTDLDLIHFNVNYGSETFVGRVLTGVRVSGRAIKSSYDFVTSPFERLGNYVEEQSQPICLNLNNF